MSDMRLHSCKTALRGVEPRSRAVWLVAIFLAELLALAVAYQFFARIECHLLAEQALCAGLKSLVARAIVVLAVAGPLLMAYPTARARFLAASRTGATGWASCMGWGWRCCSCR